MRRLNGGEIQISDVTTTTPSPFATSLSSGYVAEFMYQSDAPLAERRASVLSLDSELLRNLLGTGRSGGITRPAGHSPGGRRVAPLSAEERKVKKDC
ncbi:hypothetical protein ACLBR5_16975 [Escherichia coli]